MKIVLMYHRFYKGTKPKNDKYSINIKTFEQHLKFFKKRKFSFLTLRELHNSKEKNIVCMTFDDGAITQYEAFKLMEQYKTKGTFFIITNLIGEKGYLTVSDIKDMERNGMEIGSHTASHKNLTKLSDEDLRKELLNSKKTLELILKNKVESISLPGGEYNQKVIKECFKYGYKIIRTSDIHLVTNEKHIFPAIPIRDNFPLNNLRFLTSKRWLKILNYFKEFSKIRKSNFKNKTLTKGIFHVHTTYSYDGKISLEKLKEWCITHNVKIVFLTEHAESLNRKLWKKYEDECNKLSDNDVLLIPGLEVSCKDNHILLINPHEFYISNSSSEVIEFAKKNGITTVIAHVSPNSTINDVNLVEVWNKKYHGIAPLLRNIVWFKKSIKSGKLFYALGGNDAHKLSDLKRAIYLVFPKQNLSKINEKSRDEIITLLRNGVFYTYNEKFELSPDCKVSGNGLWMVYNELLIQIKAFGRKFLTFLKIR